MKLSFNMDYVESPPPNSRWKKLPQSILNETNILRHNVLQLQLIGINDLSAFESNHVFNSMSNSFNIISGKNQKANRTIAIISCVTVLFICFFNVIEHLSSIRCFMPNNYLVWEATRPISNCGFCASVEAPLIFPNITQAELLHYVYLPQPIIIKNAISHWPAREHLTFQYLKELYYQHSYTLSSSKDECQFLPFKSSFSSLNEFFEMPESQITTGNWYVGISHCQSNIIAQLRKLYPRPHFLPKDAEIPNTDYSFLGFNEGAVMHLDYISRLMWQAQLQGNKTWNVCPPSECDSVCSSFSFYVEPGDVVLIDTRTWYHETKTHQFSITIQSEYG